MQRLGRRVARRLDVRFGPDSVAGQPDRKPDSGHTDIISITF
jgi:hypothetical protein